MGPTDVVVTWTIAGAPATASTCMAHNASQIYLNLSGTENPSAHQDMTVPCSNGTITFSKLLVQDLGTEPYLEGTLLNAMGTSVAIVGVELSPALGTTTGTLAFFGPVGSTSSSSSSSSSSSAGSTSSSSGAGGAGSSTSTSSTSGSGTSTSSGSSSSSASSSSSSASSSSSSSSSSSGSADGG